MQFLDFEKPIADLEGKIRELAGLESSKSNSENNEEILKIREKIGVLLKKTYEKLSPWEITQVARHPERPHFIDYISGIFENFQELNGSTLQNVLLQLHLHF